MKMCLKSSSLIILLCIGILEVQSQIQYAGQTVGCGGCPQQTGQNYYPAQYPWYPQVSQQYYQYPAYSQQYQQYQPYVSTYSQSQVANSQQYYPYVPTNQPTSGSYAINTGLTAAATTGTNNQYSNVKTEFIDLEPTQFRYLYSNYLPNSNYVRPSTAGNGVRTKSIISPYVVKVDTHQHNSSYIPQIVKKHDVQHKVFTFKKTYTLNPGDKNKVINLNFLNGVPVTDTPERDIEETSPPEDNTNQDPEPQESDSTTDENPNSSDLAERKFLDVPESCPEGTTYTEGKCWKKFSLEILGNNTNTNRTESKD